MNYPFKCTECKKKTLLYIEHDIKDKYKCPYCGSLLELIIIDDTLIDSNNYINKIS